MKNVLLLILAVTLGSFLQAQSPAYDLRAYQMPDVQYRGLVFTINGAGGSGLPSQQLDYGDGFNRLKGRMNYFGFENTARLQRTYSLLTSITPYDFTKVSNRESNRNAMYVFASQRRFRYFGRNFLYFGPELIFDGQRRRTRDQGEPFYVQSKLNAKVRVPVALGRGRVERVHYAWLAARLIKRLQFTGILKRDIGASDIQGLADRIAEAKEDRVYDARLDRIFDITELDDYIQEQGWLDNYGVQYYTTLYDYYQYGIQANRQSGTRGMIGLDGQWYANGLSNRTEPFQSSGHVGLFAEYDRFNPLNLDHQLDILGSSFVGWAFPSALSSNQQGVPFVNTEMDVSWAYYPTTRTVYTLGLKAGLQYMRKGNEGDLNYALLTRGAMFYYFSPRMSFRAEVFAGHVDAQSNYWRLIRNTPDFNFPSNFSTEPSPIIYFDNLKVGYEFGVVYALF